MTKRGTILTFICGTLLFVPVWYTVAAGKEPVASINGKIITEEDVDDYILKMKSPRGDLPEEPQALLQIKQTALAKLIFKEFYFQLLESENLAVSDEEIDQKFDQMISSLPKEAIEEMKRIVDAVRRALADWHADPANERQIYETHLKRIMSYHDWGAYQNAYDVLKGVPEAAGWKEYFKAMSRKGLMKQIKWEKLKQKTTKHVQVEEAEVREEYKHSHPEPKWWNVLHFFHLQKDEVRQAANSLPQEKNRQDILTEFRRLPDDTGGVITERIINRAYLPYYAEGIRRLKEGEVGPIVFGVLSSVSNRKNRSASGTGGQYYHVLYVNHIKYEKALPFEKVKSNIEKDLLKEKKETVWQDWLLKQYKKADINVMDKRFKVPEFSDQYKSVSLMTPAEETEVSSERNQSDEEPLPPAGAVGQ